MTPIISHFTELKNLERKPGISSSARCRYSHDSSAFKYYIRNLMAFIAKTPLAKKLGIKPGIKLLLIDTPENL